MIRDSEKSLNKADVDSAKPVIEEAKKIMADNSKDVAAIKAASEKLRTMSYKLSSELYSKTGAGAAGDASGGDANGEPKADEKANSKKDGEDVIDADYKDVN